MRFDRTLGLPLMLVFVGISWASPPPEDSPVDRALKEKGLTKANFVYVLEAEKPFLAKLKEARASFAAYASMTDQQAFTQQMAEQSAQLQQSRNQLQAQMNDVNQRITQQKNMPLAQAYGGFGRVGAYSGGLDPTLAAEQEQIQNALNEVNAEQSALKNQTPQGKDTAVLPGKVKQAEDTFKAFLSELRKQVDEVKKKYRDLEADTAVKDAVKEARKTNARTRIGPSDAFNAGVKELEKAEQFFLGKKTSSTPKKKVKSKK